MQHGTEGFVLKIYGVSTASGTYILNRELLSPDDLSFLEEAEALGYLSTKDHFSMTGLETAVQILPLAVTTFSLPKKAAWWDVLTFLPNPRHA